MQHVGVHIRKKQNTDVRVDQSEQHLDKLNLAKVFEVGSRNKVLEHRRHSRQDHFNFYEMHRKNIVSPSTENGHITGRKHSI